MNKGLLIVIVFRCLISYAQVIDLAKQQECNMKTKIAEPKACHDIIAETGYKCCYEYMRLVNLNTIVCKYLKLTDIDSTEVDAEYELLKKYNAKNITIDCESGHIKAVSLLLVVLGLLF